MISDFWTPELGENTFLLFQFSPFVALCYVSPRKLTWPHGARLMVGPWVSAAFTLQSLTLNLTVCLALELSSPRKVQHHLCIFLAIMSGDIFILVSQNQSVGLVIPGLGRSPGE